MDICMDCTQHIENTYRPVPFWSLNDTLEPSETARQVRLMHRAGLGGFFMHARGGLRTPYMGEEWFENIDAALAEGEKYGMEVWAYDENGWPSGFGNGAVNGRGEAYQQKYLRIEAGEKQTDRTIANVDGWHLYYEVNPYYVDLLDKRVTEAFLEVVYEPYYQRYGNRLAGFFTDEPQLSRNGIPWSFVLPEAYGDVYGEDLLPRLPELFRPVGDYKRTRVRFWRLVTDLFSRSFAKTVYDWCEERGLRLTGHMLMEETLSSQLTANGAIMPSLEYFHIPGMDWLGRYPISSLTALEVSSVAHQLGRSQVLSESFAGSGHESGFDDFKRLIDWQMVRGITRLCPHLEGYSLRGLRKRDYPPAMYYQQPWWEQYHRLVEDLSRTGKLLGQGRVAFDTLLIHPQTTAWIYFDTEDNSKLFAYEQQFQALVDSLERKHVCFHLGDETILERHGRVEDGALVVGTQRYTRVVLPPHEALFDRTEKLLKEFQEAGGVVLEETQVPAEDIVDNPNITFTRREYPWGSVYFFVNSTHQPQKAVITSGGKLLRSADGTVEDFAGRYDFRPGESILILDDGRSPAAPPEKAVSPSLPLDGEWEVVSSTENVLTLDHCDYYFDDELIEQNGYILNIQERACARNRPVRIRMDFHLQMEYIPEGVQLLCEMPRQCRITVNGTPLTAEDVGWFVDPSFRRLPLDDRLCIGDNLVQVTVDFAQSEEVYRTLEAARLFEGEKNKLTYDMEIEPIYLLGDFGVFCHSPRRNESPYGTAFYDGPFTVGRLPKRVRLADLQEQGWLFFAGSLTLRRPMWGGDATPSLRFKKSDVNVLQVRVNGGESEICLWEPLEVPLTDWRLGELNTVELTLINNLRNMLGPHHVLGGTKLWAGPDSFVKEPGIFGGWRKWDGGYEMVRFGIAECNFTDNN